MYEMLNDLLAQERAHAGHPDGDCDGCRYCEYRREHGGTGIPVFRVVDQGRERAVDQRPVMVRLETWDWEEAEQFVVLAIGRGDGALHILGTHPTHDWDNPRDPHRCRKCGVLANGCFAAHAPCGYEIGRRPMGTAAEDETREGSRG